MDLVLDEHEARVVGSLLEKEITTPDQYPLSLNALTNACNQKSNRDPVMSLEAFEVSGALILEKSGFGSRVPKYQHRFCNTQFGTLQFSEQELGLVCVLLLRGPQTPGELRSRTQRLCRFSDVGEVEACLEALADREDGPFVVRLAREPGKRESRYAHLFSGEVQSGAAATSAAADPDHSPSLGARVHRLEQQVAELAEQLGRLRKSLGED